MEVTARILLMQRALLGPFFVFSDVVFSDVVFGDVVFGDVVFGDVVFGDIVGKILVSATAILVPSSRPSC